MPEFNVGDKVLLRNHTRDVLDLKYDIAYRVKWVMRRQLEFIDETDKTHKVNVQDVKFTYIVNGLIKYLPDDKAFGYKTKYCAHPKHLEDLHWSLNKNILSYNQDHNTSYPSSTTVIIQATCDKLDLTSKSQSSDQQPHISESSSTPPITIISAHREPRNN